MKHILTCLAAVTSIGSQPLLAATFVYDDGGSHTVNTTFNTNDYIEIDDSPGAETAGTTVTFNTGANVPGPSSISEFDRSVYVNGQGQVIINDGVFGNTIAATGESNVNVAAGTLSGGLSAYASSMAIVHGGTFGRGAKAADDGVITISGGDFSATSGPAFGTTEGGLIILKGSNFVVDGVPVGSGPFTITSAEGFISGTLQDGSTFSDAAYTLDFNSDTLNPGDFLGSIQLVPEPQSAMLCAIGLMVTVLKRRRA